MLLIGCGDEGPTTGTFVVTGNDMLAQYKDQNVWLERTRHPLPWESLEIPVNAGDALAFTMIGSDRRYSSSTFNFRITGNLSFEVIGCSAEGGYIGRDWQQSHSYQDPPIRYVVRILDGLHEEWYGPFERHCCDTLPEHRIPPSVCSDE